jgi:hypothetical protein
VTVGIGEISATPGGSQTLSVVRFIDDKIEIHAGQTVEWTNHDPVTPHTVTFGDEPKDVLGGPSSNVANTRSVCTRGAGCRGIWQTSESFIWTRGASLERGDLRLLDDSSRIFGMFQLISYVPFFVETRKGFPLDYF